MKFEIHIKTEYIEYMANHDLPSVLTVIVLGCINDPQNFMTPNLCTIYKEKILHIQTFWIDKMIEIN